jgi:outer membrane protein assembly factor BamB
MLAGGKLFVLGTTHAHCIDAKSGEPVWATELPDGASTSSFLIADSRLIALAGRLVAFDRESGNIVWKQEEVRGRKSSPTLWRHESTNYVLVNADGNKLSCVRADSGELVWTAVGGGESSPVVSGNTVVLHTNDEKLGLVAYRLDPKGAEELWRLPHKGRGSSSPIVHDGLVYLVGSGRMLCANLKDGRVNWSQDLRAEVSSPFLADGKIFALAGNGANLLAFDASPGELREFGKARVRAAWCPSPAFSGGRLLLRNKESVSCYDLRNATADKALPIRRCR